jgi:hypothetical protein
LAGEKLNFLVRLLPEFCARSFAEGVNRRVHREEFQKRLVIMTNEALKNDA